MNANLIIHHIYRLILDILYPNRCGFCDCYIPYYDYFCKTCSFRFSPPPAVNVKINHIDEFTAATVYDSMSRPFIVKVKNESNGYAIAAAAFMIYRQLLEEGKAEDFDVITFIPMRKEELRKRGYNQTKMIVKELSWLTDKPWADVLKKVKHTKSQKTLKMAERRENVKGVFACRDERKLRGKTVLLIDDVCTTGSTLSEAARVIKNSGAVRVKAAVVAKTRTIAKKRNLLEKRKQV